MKTVPLRPLNGLLDTRTQPELIPSDRFVARQNFAPSQVGGLCRRAGWQKFLSQANYNNQDLHDQLLPLQQYYNELTTPDAGSKDVSDYPSESCASELHTREQGREVITFGKELVTTEGGRYLMVGTQSRLYLLNESTGNWQIIADGMGGPSREDLSVQFKASQVLNTVILTNNYDDVVQFTLGNRASGCAMQSVKSVPELGLIGLAKAGTTIAYKGIVFLMNVVMDGVRFENRMVWSEFNDGTSYDPSLPDTIAGTQDLPYGHKILNAEIIGDFMFVYTTRGIWRASATGDQDLPVNFSAVYVSNPGVACLSFPNTLVSTGSEHYYLSQDGIYRMDIYLTEPEKVEWLHFATGDMFAELNAAACMGQVAGFNAKDQEVYFSFCKGSDYLPTGTLIFKPKFRFASYMDAGFTMFVTYHSDRRISLRDLLRDYCICDTDDTPYEYLKEGLPREGNVCDSVPTVIYSEETMVVDGLETENWNAAVSSPDSLCALLGSRKADDFCLECNVEPLMVAASSIDLCLKQIGGAFSREVCNNAPIGSGSLDGFKYESFLGQYSTDGYFSVLRTAPLDFGDPVTKTTISKIALNVNVTEQDSPPVMAVRLGKSYSPLNPNDIGCNVVWSRQSSRYFRCPQLLTPQEYVTRNLTPNVGIEYPFYTVGNYIYFEMIIASLLTQNNLKSALQPALGGEGCISSIAFEAHR